MDDQDWLVLMSVDTVYCLKLHHETTLRTLDAHNLDPVG
jgi:hypothetical protein